MSENSKKTTSSTHTKRSSKSVSALRAERAVGAVAKPFVNWCEQTAGMPAAHALQALEQVTALAAKYFDLIPAADATGFEAEPFDEAMTRLFEGLDAKTEDDIDFAWNSIHLYVDFLRETGIWTGTAEDSELVHNMFHEDLEEAGMPQIITPDLTPHQMWEGMAGTVLAQRMEAILRWIGKGRDVTSTGALRLKDIAGAGAAIGLRVTGVREDARNDATLTHVKKMAESPRLMEFWQALEAAELIEIGATRAWLAPEGEEFIDDDDQHADRFWTLSNFTSRFIDIAIHGAEEGWDPWILQTAAIETAALVVASTDSPPEVATIQSSVEQLLGTSGAGEIIDMLLARLNYLAELGIITLDTHVKVVPALVGPLADALAEALTDDDDDDIDDEEAFNGLVDGLLDIAGARPLPNMPAIATGGTRAPANAKRKGPKKDANAPMYQLKVSIQRTSPPIWRRLLVRSDVTLGDMHTIIQNSFEWENYHLHAFQVGGRGGDVYGPPDPRPFGQPDLDENACALGQVLPAEGDSMVYTYDFGDDWEHKITVEQVLPAEPNAPVARCTGGRGRGPAEDSGGPWGWSNVVAAVGDPKHAEYQEYRDWLGLSRSETFDPRAFDKAAVTEDLSRLL